MNTAFLLIGGNLGDRLATMTTAKAAIGLHCGRVVAASAIYETAAWGLEDQPHFLNQALEVQTFSKPHALLDCLLDVEKSMGRVRHQKFGPRLVDIDILLYDALIINEIDLKIPHPELQNRRFALTCLAEIAANVMHPLFQKPISQLLHECTDPLPVHKFS